MVAKVCHVTLVHLQSVLFAGAQLDKVIRPESMNALSAGFMLLNIQRSLQLKIAWKRARSA